LISFTIEHVPKVAQVLVPQISPASMTSACSACMWKVCC